MAIVKREVIKKTKVVDVPVITVKLSVEEASALVTLSPLIGGRAENGMPRSMVCVVLDQIGEKLGRDYIKYDLEPGRTNEIYFKMDH